MKMKRKGILLLLFNLINTIIFSIYFPTLLNILLNLWPFTLAYCLGIILTLIGIIWNLTFLFWPTIILKIPLLFIPLIIFIFYLIQLLCLNLIILQNNNNNNDLIKILLNNLEKQIKDKTTIISCSGISTNKIKKRKIYCCGPSKINEEEEENDDITIYDKCEHLNGWKPYKRTKDITPPPPLPINNKNGKIIK
ncbi:hypothetical protein Mgra_00004069 [Meloidogyne graminicola]|uniref:Uncharacterized protein n=1 Tax=Meloidogyne graminicola TaxID=189291 RepID=A0A8S9ZU13_9BILA|nr:hypothetical protein Mgra_00004069 [Meloidogyne graminicola]